MAEKEENGKTIKIGIVSILTLAAIILGFFFVTIINHESRLSKTEVSQEYVAKNMSDINLSLRDINAKIDGIKK